MKENIVRKRLSQGMPSIGTWLSIPSPFSSEVMAQIGLDWLVIDMEHNPMSIETAALMTSSMFHSNTVPLVRIPWNSGENIKRVLDMGAWGIVVPMVKNRQEAEQIVQEARYYPKGGRSIGGRRHAMGFQTSESNYFSTANDEILLVVQIEHIESVNNIDDILSVPGIDACFIGPNDLMSSMGLTPQLESDIPEVVEAINRVKEAAKRHGVPSGIHVGSADSANKRINEGFQFIAIGSEISFMVTNALSEIAKLDASALQQNHSPKEVRY
ncbi:HpcH/HpaI aldolase family protein [Alkalihalobacillus sp. 1P02AB]|uniref:HpcH/HpaI aldolase family protein n=1 Tax=Alkalihalobacillus sp. 1P02AB TaxID=3132260 RepID=UPI0039A6BF99